MSQEQTPTQPDLDYVPAKQGIIIALISSLPVLLSVAIYTAVQYSGFQGSGLVYLLLLVAQLLAYFWLQIYLARKQLSSKGYQTPSYWQALYIFLFFSLLCGIAAEACWVVISALVMFDSWAWDISWFGLMAISWLVPIFFIGRRLGKPFDFDTTKAVLVIAGLLAAFIAVTLLSMFITLGVGLASG